MVGVDEIPVKDKDENALEGNIDLEKNHKIGWVKWAGLWGSDSLHQYNPGTTSTVLAGSYPCMRFAYSAAFVTCPHGV